MLFLVLALVPVAARAHSAGPLDHYGCHPDRRLKDYHCHRGPLAGRHFRSKAAMLDALKNGEADQAPASEPAPQEGKRGGLGSWLPFFGRSRSHEAPPPGATIVPRGIEQRLRVLKDLYEKGLITEEEYAAKRKEILGEL